MKIVAGLFIFTGLCAVVSVIIQLTKGSVFINVDVLGVFIGPGLLRLSRGCALVYIWFAFIVSPLAILAFLFAEGPPRYALLGQTFGEAPRAVGLALTLVFFLINLWEYRVLTRPDIRRLFGLVA